MDQNSHHKKALDDQIRDSYGRVTYTYTTHQKATARLVLKNKAIKYIQIALSAISTGGIIGSLITNEYVLTCVGGLFATALLVINLFFKEFNLSEEIKQHRIASDNLWCIREQYISLLTDASVLSSEEIVSRRDELQNKTCEIYKQSPKTDAKSYAAAQRSLKEEDEQYFSDAELDKMLPKSLRKSET